MLPPAVSTQHSALSSDVISCRLLPELERLWRQWQRERALALLDEEAGIAGIEDTLDAIAR